MSNVEKDYWDLTCPKCKRTGQARIDTPEGPYAVLRGRDKPFVADCPKGFTYGRDADNRITFTCNKCKVTAKGKSG